MDLCNINDIKELLHRHGFRFSKAKGQNFLTQGWVPRQIVEAAGIDETCGVLEVGPGIGPLTEQLCLNAGKVLAVEVDRTLQPILAETLGRFDNLRIQFDDVLKQDIAKLVREEFPGLRPMACANLPYYITSPVWPPCWKAGPLRRSRSWSKRKWPSVSVPRQAAVITARSASSANTTPSRNCSSTCRPPALSPSRKSCPPFSN